MTNPLEALSMLNARNAGGGPTSYSTGISALDEVTGGFQPGQVWIIASPPGHGRSTLAVQWASEAAAVHGLETLMISPRDPLTLLAARLFARAGLIPITHLWKEQLTESDTVRLDVARAKLESASLTLSGPADLSLLDVDGFFPVPQVLVVDDAEFASGGFADRAAGLAASGTLVILTLPLNSIFAGKHLDPNWAHVADVILSIERPDLSDWDSFRPGEADLFVLRNRWGPQRSFISAFQGHYARFVE